LKVLQVTSGDEHGGANRAAMRLHIGLLKHGISCEVLVHLKSTDSQFVKSPFRGIYSALERFRPYLDRIPTLKQKHKNRPFSNAWVSNRKILRSINQSDADIVHLHYINGGMLSVKDISRINKPVVWSLHDNWAFTGGCHVMNGCHQYENGCGKCPVLGSSKNKDRSYYNYKSKLSGFNKLKNLTVVCLSNWMKVQLEKGQIFESAKSIVNLPNLINSTTFSPYSKEHSRVLLNLEPSKRYIAFGVMDLISDPNKGIDLLVKALNKLPKDAFEILVFGSKDETLQEHFLQRVHALGRIYDDVALRLLYSASNATIVPSMQENLSNVIMESLSCNTPVVAFNTSGNPDLIDHQVNGYLAKPFEIDGLSKGIQWTLENQQKIGDNPRKSILEQFDEELVIPKYIELYKDIVIGKWSL